MTISKVVGLIHEFRGHKVMVDRDLAKLYGVRTKVLNQAVRRRLERFPGDFMFQLTAEETKNWKSQIVTSNSSLLMGLRKRPFVFTEHGVAMLSSVLNSPHAVRVNIEIMRTFVRLRRALAVQSGVSERIQGIERVVAEHDRELSEHAAQLNEAFAAIHRLES